MTTQDGADRGMSGQQPRAVERALRVLEAVAANPPGVTAKDLAEQLGLPPATLYRLLTILVAEGYLVRLPDLRGFALGRRIGDLVARPVQDPAVAAVDALAAKLAADVGTLPVGLHVARFEAGGVAAFASHDPHRTHGPGLELDEIRAALAATAVGKVLLAETRAGNVGPRGELAQVAALGLARQVDELRSGLACVAAPVRAAGGRLVAAVALSAPSAVHARHETELGQLTRRYAAALGLGS